MSKPDKAAIFDLGRVMFQWQLRALFEKLIDDQRELDWFLSTVVTEEWHFQHDRGRALDEMVAERIVQYPDHAHLVEAYARRFNETVPGPVEGTLELIERLHAQGVPLFCLTNFGHELFARFRPTQPIFELFDDIVVSGTEQVAKPEQRIYEITESRTGRAGSALFFTDDNPANIAAAKARGWDAHLFTDAAALEAQLIGAGLL